MGSQIVVVLMTLAVGFTMLWAGLAKNRLALTCRSCGQPLERCRCDRPARHALP